MLLQKGGWYMHVKQLPLAFIFSFSIHITVKSCCNFFICSIKHVKTHFILKIVKYGRSEPKYKTLRKVIDKLDRFGIGAIG